MAVLGNIRGCTISQEDERKISEIDALIGVGEFQKDQIDAAFAIAQTLDSKVALHFVLSEVGQAYLSAEGGYQKAYEIVKIKQEMGDIPRKLLNEIFKKCIQVDRDQSINFAQKICEENKLFFASSQYRNEFFATQARKDRRQIKASIFEWIKIGDEPSLRWMFLLLSPQERRTYFSSKEKFNMAWTGGGEEELTPLQIASWRGNLSIVRLLIECGAPVNDLQKTSAVTERSSLHVAMDARQTHIVSLLLSKGAKDGLASCVVQHGLRKYHFINQSEAVGVRLSALHMAIINNWHPIARELLTLNATDVTYQASGGNSSLHLAARIGDADMVHMLLSFGAQTCLNLQNDEGETPNEIAIKKGHEHLMPLLS